MDVLDYFGQAQPLHHLLYLIAREQNQKADGFGLDEDFLVDQREHGVNEVAVLERNAANIHINNAIFSLVLEETRNDRLRYVSIVPDFELFLHFLVVYDALPLSRRCVVVNHALF